MYAIISARSLISVPVYFNFMKRMISVGGTCLNKEYIEY
jgi:hypothetical protein